MSNDNLSVFTKKIISLKDSLDYQDNSIVSKTLITKEEGSITLFAFDKGQLLSTHTTPVDAMVQVIEGTVEIVISDEKFTLNEGEIIIMPAHEPHSLTALSKFKMMLVKI